MPDDKITPPAQVPPETMPQEDISSVYRLGCAHCGKSGTCKSGPSGSSCAVCVNSAEQMRVRHPFITTLMGRESAPKSSSVMVGLVCSVCQGTGTTEPKTLKFLNRFLPIFSASFVLVLVVLLIIFAFAAEKYFPSVLAFVSTAVGSVTGYYFGGSKEHMSSVVHPPGP